LRTFCHCRGWGWSWGQPLVGDALAVGLDLPDRLAVGLPARSRYTLFVVHAEIANSYSGYPLAVLGLVLAGRRAVELFFEASAAPGGGTLYFALAPANGLDPALETFFRSAPAIVPAPGPDGVVQVGLHRRRTDGISSGLPRGHPRHESALVHCLLVLVAIHIVATPPASTFATLAAVALAHVGVSELPQPARARHALAAGGALGAQP